MNLPLKIIADESGSDPKYNLGKQLKQLFSADFILPSHESFVQIIRLEEPVFGYQPLQWLRRQNFSTRLYWSDRQLDFEAAGVGLADQIKIDNDEDHAPKLSKIKEILGAYSGKARYYGGMRFNSKARALDRHWLPYGSCLFILPQFEFISDATGSYLACNVVIRSGQRPHRQLNELLGSLDRIKMTDAQAIAYPKIQSFVRQDSPVKEKWLRSVGSVLNILKSGKAEKIVLGRSSHFSFDKPLDPLFLIQKLKEIEPGAYHFCIQPEEGSAFIGATPERLYGRRVDFIQSEAVAGTCGRGLTPEADRELGEDLLRSEKDCREHICVRDTLKAQLQPCCRYLEVGEVKLQRQARVQHLYSYIRGQLLRDIADADLLKLLHPTPAVGGLPRERALDDIARLEPFDRGWYAGPIGWIGTNTAEFAVGIRSGLVNGSSLRLFAGAGVVEGSLPELEWDEMETKISAFLSALGIE